MESVVSVNVTNFITIGLMSLVFIFVAHFLLKKAGVNVAA